MKIKEILNNIAGSLDNKQNSGFSARKLTAAILMVCIILIHLSWLKHAFLREDYRFIVEILSIDSLFVLLLLGIVTIEQITKLKNSNKNEIKEEKQCQ